MTKYVLGFMFDGDRVALIRKNRPKWQNGLLNGVGGHVDADEDDICAMTREFWEETGMRTRPGSWKPFATLKGDGFDVRLFVAAGDVASLKTTTDEAIVVIPYKEISEQNAVSNLVFLLPMAKRRLDGKLEYLGITEIN